MNILWPLVILFSLTQFVASRDFYLGMFRRNDLLVAQDVIYKAPSPFGYTTASYGRLFQCPITYFRVVDRLGKGRGPFTTIVRGGLRKKYISVRIKSAFRLPVSVNIYVGCEKKEPTTPTPLTTRTGEKETTKKPISTDASTTQSAATDASTTQSAATDASTDVATHTTEKETEGPETTTEGPETTTEGPETTTEGPETTTEGPETTTEGPEITTEGPETTTEGSDNN